MNDCIDISIFMLHHKKKMDFTIQLPEECRNSKDKTHPKVFFGCCRDTIIVYLPGWYLNIVDCCKEHDPWSLMSFYGPDTVPNMWNKDIPSKKLERYALSLFSASNTGGYIMDLKRGTLYNYDFSFDSLLNWIVQLKKNQYNKIIGESVNIRKTIIQFLHLAITHLKNGVFIEKAMRKFCEPQLLENVWSGPKSVDNTQYYTLVDDEVFFMEYLIGTSYMELTQNISQNTGVPSSTTSTNIVDREFLKYIPISLLECGSNSIFVDDDDSEWESGRIYKIGHIMGSTPFTKSVSIS